MPAKTDRVESLYHDRIDSDGWIGADRQLRRPGPARPGKGGNLSAPSESMRPCAVIAGNIPAEPPERFPGNSEEEEPPDSAGVSRQALRLGRTIPVLERRCAFRRGDRGWNLTASPAPFGEGFRLRPERVGSKRGKEGDMSAGSGRSWDRGSRVPGIPIRCRTECPPAAGRTLWLPRIVPPRPRPGCPRSD